MKIKLINYYLFSVPVSFEISKIHIPYSRHIIVELDVDSKRSFGEGISYKSSLSQVEKFISEIDWKNINWENLINKEPGLAAAIDQAIHCSNRSLPGGITYTKQIFIESVDTMVDEASRLVNSGCKDIKLKLGRKVTDDIRLIKVLKNKFSNINFKADVNCGYSASDFIKVLDKNCGFIKTWEEPVRKVDQKFLADLKNKYQIKIMLDESVKTINELNYYIKEKIINVLNIKLSRVGGVTKAMEYIKICKKNNIRISVGCSEELGVGMIAIDFLASQIQNVFGVEGIGSERLRFDIIEDGKFSKNKLFEADQKFGFKVFEKNIKPTFFDNISETKDNYLAKFNNLRVRLKTI